MAYRKSHRRMSKKAGRASRKGGLKNGRRATRKGGLKRGGLKRGGLSRRVKRGGGLSFPPCFPNCHTARPSASNIVAQVRQQLGQHHSHSHHPYAAV